MRSQNQLTRWLPAVFVAEIIFATGVVRIASTPAAEAYVEPLCTDQHGHEDDYHQTPPYPTPILGFAEQEAVYSDGSAQLRMHVNPGSGEIPFRTLVVWSSKGVTRCEACGAWTGPKALNGNQRVELTDVNLPLEMLCTSVEGHNVGVSMPLHYLPRPEPGRAHVEPHSEQGG